MQNDNKNFELNISTLKNKIEELNKEKSTNEAKFKSEMNNQQKIYEDLKAENKIMNQSTKQIFLQYLTNDMYI